MIELFNFIGKYQPLDVEMQTNLIPFLPEYIPSIGDIDAFIKIPAPNTDIDDSILGLEMLDEPATEQSNPTVLEMQLRALSKASGITKRVIILYNPGAPYKIHSIESTKQLKKNPKQLNAWIKSLQELNQSKPSYAVKYSRKMPNVELLMQAWSSEMEPYMNKLQDELKIDKLDTICIKDYVKMICAIMDIPIGKGNQTTQKSNAMIESLHVLFEVYSAFKNSQHFN